MPVNRSAPTITGAAVVGQTLIASPGSWCGLTPITYSYAWSDGKTGQTDLLDSSDRGQKITAIVTATNAAGSSSATSLPVGPVAASPPPPPPATGLHVSGNQLLDQNNNVVRLHGADYSGTEYACVGGYGFFDGNTPTQAYVTNLLAAHVNVVRIPMNEDCWLGIGGVNPAYAGSNYQSAIENWVALLEANGITPILDLHWTAPGTQLATGQQRMADADHSPAFWQSVAQTFGSDDRVIFDLFNEPHDVSWACWRDGGSSCGTGFTVAGMQTLIDAVRNAGATNVLMLGCLGYSNDCQDSGGSWDQYRPTDPLNNLAASVHIYIGNGCQDTTCWNQTWLPILQNGNPIIVGEWASYDYNGRNYNESFGTTLLDWFDANAVSGEVAWTWNNWCTWSASSCAEPLIQAGDGSVLSTWGSFMSSQYASRFH